MHVFCLLFLQEVDVVSAPVVSPVTNDTHWLEKAPEKKKNFRLKRIKQACGGRNRIPSYIHTIQTKITVLYDEIGDQKYSLCQKSMIISIIVSNSYWKFTLNKTTVIKSGTILYLCKTCTKAAVCETNRSRYLQ